MVINALVSYITSNDAISYFHPDYASRTEIFIKNGELTQLILGDDKKTVILYVWYDNEFGYSTKLVELFHKIHKQG